MPVHRNFGADSSTLYTDTKQTLASPAVQSKTQLDPDIFRAYDIRGVVETSLTPTAVYWIGRAFAAEALSQGQRSAVVAGDGRNSTPSLCRSLAKGLNEGGINVIDIGMVPTPLLYYATHRIDEPELAGTQSPVGTGIMITGSQFLRHRSSGFGRALE